MSSRWQYDYGSIQRLLVVREPSEISIALASAAEYIEVGCSQPYNGVAVTSTGAAANRPRRRA